MDKNIVFTYDSDIAYGIGYVQAKRKPTKEIWSGDTLGVAEITGFAPSACNLQPWFVENAHGKLTVFRYREKGRRGIMPAGSVTYYQRIDIGIFLCIQELCLHEKNIVFDRRLFPDAGEENIPGLRNIFCVHRPCREEGTPDPPSLRLPAREGSDFTLPVIQMTGGAVRTSAKICPGCTSDRSGGDFYAYGQAAVFHDFPAELYN